MAHNVRIKKEIPSNDMSILKETYIKNGITYKVLQRRSKCKICGSITFKRGDELIPPTFWCLKHWNEYRSNYIQQWHKTPKGRAILNKSVQNWRRSHKAKWAEIMANYRDRISEKAVLASQRVNSPTESK